jgi:hypothetical protein
MSGVMTFDVEVVLKGRDTAVTESVSVGHGEPVSWDEAAVHDVLVEILRAIGHVENPDAPPDRAVRLQGFSWIVQPAAEADDQVVIAIEIPMGAAVAGPFAVDGARLDALITAALRAERAGERSPTIH